jgi:ribosome-associated toxin RatA of RatAB toxin-antitoxin module
LLEQLGDIERLPKMTLVDEIIIRAPVIKIFAVASNLPRWPEFLPHYRYNRFISQTPSGGIVRMSCVSSRMTVNWISEYRIDTENRQLHFHHLKSTLNATRGMKVVWDFEELADGFVRVSIRHDLDVKSPLIGRAIARWVAGRFLIHDIAGKTLAGLKRKAEAQEYLRAIPVQ